MKKILLLSFGIILFLSSCTSEESNSNSLYTYEIKKIFGSKIIFSHDGLGQYPLNFFKEYDYVIDTVEINLNGQSSGSLGFKIESSAFINITTPARGVNPHVNYIKFINLKSNWEDNKTQKIYLVDKYNVPPKFFTYSECNINLNNYPNFFIDNPFYPSYAMLLVKPKVNNDIKIIKSNNDYPVGSEFYYNELKYKVISKK